MAGVPRAVMACEHWSAVQPCWPSVGSLVVVGHRPGEHQPAPRVRPVGMEGLEVGVEVPRLVVVVPEAPQCVGDVRRAGVGRCPVAQVGVVAAEEPAGPRREVDRGGDEHDRGEGREGVADQGADPRPADTRRTPGAHVPEQRHQAEHGDEVQPAPLGGAGHAEAEAGEQPPGPPAEPRAEPGTERRRRARPPAGPAPSRGRPRGAPNAASTQNISSGSSSAVRLCTNSSPSTVSSSPATQPSSVERDSRRPMRAIISTVRVPTTRRPEPPAERGEPEQLLADRDHPLAARRVHDVGRVAGPQPVQVAREDLAFAGSGSPSVGAVM